MSKDEPIPYRLTEKAEIRANATRDVLERRVVIIQVGDNNSFPEMADWLSSLEKRQPPPDVRFTIEVLAESSTSGSAAPDRVPVEDAQEA